MTGGIAARAKQTNVSYQEMERTYVERVSLRRMVTAEDLVASVAFLLSPAGRNIAGQSLGWMAMWSRFDGAAEQHFPGRPQGCPWPSRWFPCEA